LSKRFILSVTVMTMLATLMIATVGYAKSGTGPSPDPDPGPPIDCSGTCDGTEHDETITGSDKHDEIRAKGGRDTVYGKGGDDDLYGNGGGDTIYGGTGNDNLYGGGGNDKLYDNQGPNTGAAPDIDNLYGGDGDDYLNAVDGDELDTLDGGADNDTCEAETRDKYISCETEIRWTPSGNLTPTK
jgi:hypothetical protein